MMKRKIRNRHLTAQEAADHQALRDQIARDKPQISARIRGRMADKRRADASTAGRKTLGQRIRAARESQGQSQVALAAAAGISQGYLSQLEQDERDPTLTIAARLARALNMSLDELASDAA
jgi:DNA-binding XRE family transcriptional regulator